MSVNNIGLKSYEDLFKDDKGRKTEEIVPMDIKELKPSLMGDKEVYIIKTTKNDWFLEVYLNTEYGCEYTLYGDDYSEIEGGVIDDVEYENATVNDHDGIKWQDDGEEFFLYIQGNDVVLVEAPDESFIEDIVQ